MRRCMGCMKEYEDELIMCPHCGYVEEANIANENHLPASSILQGRYIVGKVLVEEVFGICYMSFDALLERRVFIYEVRDRDLMIKNIESEIVDEFLEEGNTYMITDYKKGTFPDTKNVMMVNELPIEDLPMEDLPVQDLKIDDSQGSGKNKMTILIVVSVISCLILILLLVLIMNPIEEKDKSYDDDKFYDDESNDDESNSIWAGFGLDEDSYSDIEIEAENEEIEEEIIEEEIIEEESEEESEEVEEPEVVETLVLGDFVDIMGEDVMEFIIANFWEKTNYDEGTVTGIAENLSNDFLENSINSNVATQILKESTTEESLILEGVITVLVSEYNGNYISAPYWFTYEMDQYGNYSVQYEEIENTASEVSASYEQKDEYGAYVVENVLDGDPTTTWSPQYANDSYAVFEYTDDVEIYGVLLLNGYWKSSETYSNNGRVSQLGLYSETDNLGTFSLDTASYSSSIADEGIYNYMLLFDEPVVSSELFVVLEDSIAGSKYEDVCVSEILVIAR